MTTVMDFSDPRFWLDALQSAVLVVLWLRKPGQNAVELSVALNNRLLVVEERLTHMTTDDELTELAGAVKVVESETRAQTHQLESVRIQLNRIENYLLHSKK